MTADRDAERALVEQVLAGDPRARRRLVQTYERSVRRSVGFLAHNRYQRAQPADVDDAVQHVFLTVFANDAQVLVSWQGTASLRTYLCRIAERVAGRHFGRVVRGQGRFKLDLDAPSPEGAAPIDRVADDAQRVDARLVEAEEQARLRAAILAELTDLGRVYYQALFIDGLSVAEIALQEGTTANNIYQWKNRILRVAHQILAANGYLTEGE